MGDAIVKPSRLRNAAKSTAGTDRSYLNSLENIFILLADVDVDVGGDGEELLFVDCWILLLLSSLSSSTTELVVWCKHVVADLDE